MSRQLFNEIDALFEPPVELGLANTALAGVYGALHRYLPVQLWLANDQGQLLSIYSSPGETVRHPTSELVTDFANRLGDQSEVVFKNPQSQYWGFAVSVPGPGGFAGTVAGLLAQPDIDIQRFKELGQIIGCCGALILQSQQVDRFSRQQAARVNQLQNERDTIRGSYEQTMGEALQEREKRLSQQAQHMDRLELEVAKRSADLREALVRAEQSNHSKTEFLANMSHEIRTPMTSILGYTDLLIQESWGRDKAMDWLQVIRRNGEHLLAVINDILDISKVEAGKLIIEKVSCSPIELIHGVQEIMSPRAYEQGLDFSVQFIGPIPQTILSDPTRLRQVLMNLVGNAIKFTKSGGSVRVGCQMVETKQDKPNLIRFQISDTGVGMKPKLLGKLFQPFTQADATTTRKFGGTGLGLAISRRLAQMLGGDITVTSMPEQGSIFSVIVQTGSLDGATWVEGDTVIRPKTQTQSLSPRVLPDANQAQNNLLAGARILLAEDGLDNQRLISLLLRRAGAEVTVVENGQLAYKQAMELLVQGKPFDVIFMDMQMPIQDGYSATKSLRSQGYAGPIVALTAHAMAGERQKCLDAGCDDYATKPIDVKRLIELAALHYASMHRPTPPQEPQPVSVSPENAAHP